MEMTRENAVKIDYHIGTLDNAIKKLLEYQARGESVYIEFNGHKLYSCDISVDGAYQELFGMTKEEWEKNREALREEMLRKQKEEKEKAEAKTKEKMPEWIAALREINKEEVDERGFYEKVLGIIKQMEGVSFTPEIAEELKTTLEEIGCKRYEDWKEEKELAGEIIEEKNLRDGIEKADIGAAVSFISQLMYTYENAEISLGYMLDGGEEYGWVQRWLANSKTLYGPEKENAQEVSSKYTDIEQIRRDIESLGDWKDPDQRDNYLRVISKIIAINNGYELDDGKTKYYPESVIRAIAHICSKKFPSKEEVFIDGKLKPGMPDGEFSNFVVHSTTPLGISLLAERTRIGEIASQEFGIDVDHTRMTEEEVGRLIESSEEYLAKNLDKFNIPYYNVAKQALMNWNGLSEEEADKIISEQTFSQIEGQVYAKGSIDYAIKAIAKSFYPTFGIASELHGFVYYGVGREAVDRMKKEAEFMNNENNPQVDRENMRKKYNNMIMDTLFSVHDGWVKDNVKKFNARDKKHQHMPSELIGWNEVKSDLIFVKPIFEAVGVEINEEELEKVYNERVKEFFLSRGIKTARNLSDSITQGEEFYPPLVGYGEILEDINNPEYVDKNIIPAIEGQGIGNIESVRARIVEEIKSNPTPEDVSRLSDEEQSMVEQSLGQEVTELTEVRDELHEKNSKIARILALAKRRDEVKREIEEEQQKKDKNITDFSDN